MTLAEREALYWNDVIAARDDAERADWTARSAAVRAAPDGELRYGAHPSQAVDLFLPGADDAPLLLFVHGGYWQAGCREDNCAPAPFWTERGWGYGAVGYRLLGESGLGGAVADVRAALALVIEEARGRGIDPARIVLAGHSAGAHLAAMTRLANAPALLAGLVLTSGVYDLRPLTGTTPGAALAAGDMADLASGPLGGGRSDDAATLILFGDRETAAFKAQSKALATAWPEASIAEIAGADHYTILHEFERPGSAIERFAQAVAGATAA